MEKQKKGKGVYSKTHTQCFCKNGKQQTNKTKTPQVHTNKYKTNAIETNKTLLFKRPIIVLIVTLIL